MGGNNLRDVYGIFADIMGYPARDLAGRVKECVAQLSSVNREAAATLNRFSKYVERTPLSLIEESYTSTFDLQAQCYPYAGYHLFGESYMRGEFMAKLKERYTATGFSPGGELPDHVAIILRFLSTLEDEDESRVLIDECLKPTLSGMIRSLEGNGNPYGEVVHALLLTLQTPLKDITMKGSAGRRRGRL